MSEYYVVKDKPSKNPDGRWLSGPGTKWVEPIDVLKIPEVEGLTMVKDLNQKIIRLRKALEFYADPENYHAILVLPDRPSGAFADDFSDDHGHPDYNRPMPGKMARAVLYGQT